MLVGSPYDISVSPSPFGLDLMEVEHSMKEEVVEQEVIQSVEEFRTLDLDSDLDQVLTRNTQSLTPSTSHQKN